MKFLLFVGLFSFSVCAQDISDASAIEKKLATINVEGWQSKLILNMKQKEKMLALVTMYEMGKNRIYKSNDSMDSKNKDLMLLEEAHYIELGEVLNEKQFKIFKAKIAEIKSTN